MTEPPGRGLFTDASQPEPPADPAPVPTAAPRRRGSLRIVVAVAVVAVAVFAVTAFVAPGFLLGVKDVPVGPRETADRLVTALNGRDAVTLDELKCPAAEPDVDKAIAGAERVRELTVDSVRDGSKSESVLSLRGRVDGTPASMRGRLLNSGGTWCWQDITLFTPDATKTPAPDPAAGTPRATAKRFVDALNSRDAAAAEEVACDFAGRQLATAVGKITAGNPALSLGAEDGTGFTFEGVLDGGPVRGVVVVQGDCVGALNLT